MRTAFVTGGAGFIGSCLARKLLSDGWKVDIIDNLSTGDKANIPEEAQFNLLDLSESELATKLPAKKYDAIFHFAAQSSGEISFDDPVYDLKTNCLSTVILLDWCLKNGTDRFINISSMSIYGDQENQPVSENAVANPNSFYGIGKYASERYVKIYSKLGLKTTSLRLFNVYGPGQNMKNLRQGMVSIYMAYLLKGEDILVKGSPERYRDLIYIDDVISAIIACLDNEYSYGKEFNVGSGIPTTVQELLNAEIKAFGYDPETYGIVFSDPTPGDMFGINADISRIKDAIGWEPKVTLQQGLKAMVASLIK